MEDIMEEQEGVVLKMSALSVGVVVIGHENAHQLVVIEDGTEILLQSALELAHMVDTEIAMTVTATWIILVMVDSIVATETALKVEASKKLVTCIQWRAGMVHQETVW
ncbi:BnaA01g22520D [Brassica napus]|uniref:BnaA01g22520D protein n=1 Tax=Brassica napus TaxID=3708 RepID=A0A078GIZ2_BRANA|nr:BnaA01g22520D [Brassica napus]